MAKNVAAKKVEPEAVTETAEVVEVVELTKAQQAAIDAMATWSAKMRYLNDQGYTRGQIAKALGKRYQHVRNVLITPVAKTKAE